MNYLHMVTQSSIFSTRLAKNSAKLVKQMWLGEDVLIPRFAESIFSKSGKFSMYEERKIWKWVLIWLADVLLKPSREKSDSSLKPSWMLWRKTFSISALVVMICCTLHAAKFFNFWWTIVPLHWNNAKIYINLFLSVVVYFVQHSSKTFRSVICSR